MNKTANSSKSRREAWPSALQLDVQGCEGLDSDEVMHDSRSVRVVRAVVETVYGARGVFKALISADHLQAHLLLPQNRFSKHLLFSKT